MTPYLDLKDYTSPPPLPTGWRRAIARGTLVTDGFPDESKCRQFGKDIADAGPDTLGVVNIEIWPTDSRKHGEQVVAKSVAKLIQATRWVREGAGKPILLSHYSLPVNRDYYVPIRNVPAEVAALKAANDCLRSLADELDVLSPSLYSFYESDSGVGGPWHKFASFSVGEATRLGRGKPVIPFVWWRWHPGETTKDSTIWRQELRTTLGWKRVDGVIVWDSATFNDRFKEGTGERIYNRAWHGGVLWRTTLDVFG